MPAEGGGEKARGQDGRHAVEVGGAGAQGDEGEHVEAAVHQGSPAAPEEGKSAPEDDGGGQEELDPAQGARRDPPGQRVPGDHLRHPQDDQRNGQDKTRLEPAGHLLHLRAGLLLEGDLHRLEGHAAQRTGAGARLPDLGMHGTGVGRAGARRRRRGRGGRRGDHPRTSRSRDPARSQILFRVRLELRQAAPAAEVVGGAAVLVLRRGPGGIHVHVADGILDGGARRGGTRLHHAAHSTFRTAPGPCGPRAARSPGRRWRRERGR